MKKNRFASRRAEIAWELVAPWMRLGVGVAFAAVLGYVLVRRARHLGEPIVSESEARDLVEEGSLESFPASDPPASMPPRTRPRTFPPD